MHDAMKAYHESWERDLDRQFLKKRPLPETRLYLLPFEREHGGRRTQQHLACSGIHALCPHHAGIPGTRPPTPICPCSCVTM